MPALTEQQRAAMQNSDRLGQAAVTKEIGALKATVEEDTRLANRIQKGVDATRQDTERAHAHAQYNPQDPNALREWRADQQGLAAAEEVERQAMRKVSHDRGTLARERFWDSVSGFDVSGKEPVPGNHSAQHPAAAPKPAAKATPGGRQGLRVAHSESAHSEPPHPHHGHHHHHRHHHGHPHSQDVHTAGKGPVDLNRDGDANFYWAIPEQPATADAKPPTDSPQGKSVCAAPNPGKNTGVKPDKKWAGMGITTAPSPLIDI